MMGKKHIKKFLSLLFLASCSSTASQWQVDSMPGATAYSCSRLRFSDAENPLAFEMLKIGEQIEAFLSLNRFRLSSTQVKILLTTHGETYEQTLTTHEGRMRVKLPQDLTQRLIQALQDGEKVGIVIDGFEEMLKPEQFSTSFAQFLGEGSWLQNLLKRPAQ